LLPSQRVDHIVAVFQYWNVCAKWILHMLTAEMKTSSIEVCQQLLSCYEKEGEEFLHSIVTADETWMHHYEPKASVSPWNIITKFHL
jgi:hypothetical protein